MQLGQSKLASFVEACVGTLAGLVFSFVLQKVLNYAYDVTMSNEVAAWMVFWFTIASVARSYIVRRAANWWQNRKHVAPTGMRILHTLDNEEVFEKMMQDPKYRNQIIDIIGGKDGYNC